MRRSISLAVCACLLSGCATTPLKTDGQVTAEDVMRRVKDELSQYYAYERAHANDPALPTACLGKLEFKIKTVTVTLNSQSDEISDVSASATLPVGAAGTLGPSLDVSGETKSTTTTKYTFYPADPGPAPPALVSNDKWVGFPIANSIEKLRESLLKASDTKPCVGFMSPADPGPPAKPAGPIDQTVTFDFNLASF